MPTDTEQSAENTTRELYGNDELDGATVEDSHYGRGTVRETLDDARALVDFEEKHNPVDISIGQLKLVEVSEE